jgi:GNAT superfamily N-acetyltransferase
MDGRITDLGGGYTARRIPLETYRDACARLEGRIFGGNSVYAFGRAARPPVPLGETFTWGLFAGDELVGWSHAEQRDERTVDMADTGLLPEHQGRGLYTRLLPTLLGTFRAAGYALVTSRHRATNNAVLVPKLRAGFFIQGLNLYEGGLNVTLALALDGPYRDAMHARSGFRAATAEAARRLRWPEAVPPGPVPVPSALPLPPGTGPDLDLGGGYVLRPVEYETYWHVYAVLEDSAYESVSLEWPRPAARPDPDLPSYTWLVGHAGEVVGWHSSRGWNARAAYMVNTALLPAHRGVGVYSRLLPAVLDALRAEGYDLVRSQHHATNSAVLVPKLHAGFRLQGLEVGDHGVMAVLIYSYDEVYREYMDVRSGLTRPRGEVARQLGMVADVEG